MNSSAQAWALRRREITDFAPYHLTYIDVRPVMEGWIADVVIGGVATVALAFVVRGLLPKLASRSKNTFDDFVVKRFSKYIIPLGILFTLFLLQNDLNLDGNLARIGSILLRFSTLIILVRIFNSILLRSLEIIGRRSAKDGIDTLITSVTPLIRASIWTIAILICLQSLGFPMAAIWAVLSAGGIGIGLALKEPAQELFAYLMILIDKPFSVGQFINVGDIWATVEKVGVRSSRLRSLRGETIVMNNSLLTTSTISNFAEMKERRMIYRLGVTYQTSHDTLARIPALIQQVIDAATHARFERCHFVEFGASSLDLELVYHIDTRDYGTAMDTQQQINLDILRRFEEEGIAFAYPTQTLLVESTSPGR
ncbi:MAG: mechanosensitive ion channel family protein [Synechococcus sp.]